MKRRQKRYHSLPVTDRREFLAASIMASLGFMAGGLLPGQLFAAKEGKKAGARPNILLILGDDLGYADIGAQGCKDVPTPNIDSIAANGVRFTHGYVSCPVCSPTRAGLMTGRYQQRFGHEFNPGPENAASEQFGLPLEETTLATRLKEAGYTTGIVGKWHLGYNEPFRPQKRGFDEFFGFLGGAHKYLNNNNAASGIMRGNEPVAEPEYLTDALGREAAAFVDRHKDKPFFLYLAFNAVHTPQDVIDKYTARFNGITDPRRMRMAAMLSAMDDAVGKVLGKLREHELEKNTLIIFLTDNGGPTRSNASRNDPLRGYKGEVLEGGIRIPFFMQWKGHIPAGKVVDQPVISLDIHPTCLAAAGFEAEVPKDKALDGVDLVPYLGGKAKSQPHEFLFWRFGEQTAVRKGQYKLVRGPDGAEGLYDVTADPHEDKDLLAEKPEIAKELREAFDKWNAQLVPGRWRRQRPGKAGDAATTGTKAGKKKGAGKAGKKRAKKAAAVDTETSAPLKPGKAARKARRAKKRQ